MSLLLNSNEPAIVRGIKMVGVGKKGSKTLTPALALEILEDLKANAVSPAAKGAFFAGLLAKGIEGPEEILGQAFAPGTLTSPQRLVEKIAFDAPEFVRWICIHLLTGHTLDKKTAFDLGTFLFSNEPGDGARGLIASFLRVRYETDEEYEGIWLAMQETLVEAFTKATPSGEPIVHLAEPFDGNDHSFMITPLLGDYIQSLGYRVIHMVGRNSGPKLFFNLLDVMENLSATFAQSTEDLRNPKPRYGWVFHQKDMSPALDRWVDIRRQTVKRPFLATLEKFIKPAEAHIIVTSAFHPPYGEKMRTVSERTGFPGVMVIRNGIEGSMAFPLKRPAKILLSARQKEGSYLRHEMTFDVEGFLGETLPIEERREHITALANAQLIKTYTQKGSSGDVWFDLRVKTTCAGFHQALQWLKENIII